MRIQLECRGDNGTLNKGGERSKKEQRMEKETWEDEKEIRAS